MENWLSETTFGIMVGVALVVGHSRISWPLKWAETFYHELSHGLICLLTGGRIRTITLNWDGSGCCTTYGGWRIPTLLAGYMGASLWGGLLYMVGWLLGSQGGTWWLKAELLILGTVTLFWVRDLRTLIIVAFIAGVYGASLVLPNTLWLPYILQFIGIYVMLNAIRAPLFLIDGEHVGDGAALADAFVIIPEGLWILFWFLFALATMAACMVLTLPHLSWVLPFAGITF